ncbi:MAG: GldG family protein [Chloroflexi bacterium]|nr:GldG family protein [Chloroflexota bacterium]
MALNTTSTKQGGFSLGALRAPVAALGVLLILAGLGWWLVNGAFDLPPRLLVAGGILLVGVVIALEPGDVWSAVTGRSGLYTSNTLVIAIAAVGILGLANVIGSRYSPRWDLTASKQFTISDQSVRVAESLPGPVKVTAFLSGSDSRRADFEALLGEYARRANGKLTWEFIDPELRPGEAIAAGIRNVGDVVYQLGDKKQNSSATQERDVTTALIKLTRPEKKLYFTTGHGERKISGQDPPDYGQLQLALQRDNFTTADLSLATTRAVPDDAAAVVIAGPTGPFQPDELDALRVYLDGGGKLMLFQDPNTQANFTDLLRKWEVSFPNQFVVDPGLNAGDPLVPAVVSYGTSPITQGLRTGAFFPGAGAITYARENTAVTPIAQTTDRSWIETDTQSVTVQRRPVLQDNDVKGPVALAVAIEQAVPGSGASSTTTGSARQTRLFLVGTANFVANQFQQVQFSSDNVDLFINAANWMADQTDISGIRPTATDTRNMFMTNTQQNLLLYGSALFLPLVVVVAGVAMWWTRR